MNRVKELREEKKMQQGDLANLVGVSQGTLSNWERGVHDVDNTTLIKLSEIFAATTDYILGVSDIRTIEIPPELKNVKVAFHGGAFDGLDEDDMDMLLDMARHLREKKEKMKKGE